MENNTKILNSLVLSSDNRDEIKKRKENGKHVLQDLMNTIQNCQNRFGGKPELATEDDIRIINLCDKWEKTLSHGIRTNLSNSTIQNLVTAGLNFTFNIVNVGNSLWSYTCLHLTKHEKERFKIMSNINTPLGYFRAFLRASLNERSLERYLQSWISHGLSMEYYDEGALVRDNDVSNNLPSLAAGLSSILFALSIDRAELNESQSQHANLSNRTELVIPLPMPMKSSTNIKKKPIRQVISFDKNDPKRQSKHSTESSESIRHKEDSWKSAPATCLNSPDPVISQGAPSAGSEPTSSDHRSLKQFFPDNVKVLDSPSQILSRLSEKAKEIFASSSSIDTDNVMKDDLSDLSINNLKISESDSEEVAGSIDGSTSCLELCFNEYENIPDDKNFSTILENRDKEYYNLQLKCRQIELASKEKIQKLENVVLDLSKENDNLKEQLKQYISAVNLRASVQNDSSDEEQMNLYERKLVQVAEMHAELMEFNQHLQRRLHDLESSSLHELDNQESNVKVHIPSAFLVGKKTHSYHIYQIFIKVGIEEWNVYHRYSEFYELHTQLKKCHPDIGSYKFPPKKTLRKKDIRLVEARRVALQTYLRQILLIIPELRECTSRAQLITLLPFFGTSVPSARENGLIQTTNRSQHIDSASTFGAL